MSTRPRLLFLVTEDWYFCSHRLPLARAATEAGFEVSVATRVTNHGDHIAAAGLELIPLKLSRHSQNPLRELAALWQLVRVYRAVRPDIVHHVAIKPVLYGSLAARLTGVPAVVNALAGLGYVFSSADLKGRVLRPAIVVAYRLLLDQPGSRLIVQKPDDLRLFTGRGIVDASRDVLIRGSGVDLSRFAATPEPEGVPLVVLPARMLRDKGVVEFVEAARLLKARDVVALRVGRRPRPGESGGPPGGRPRGAAGPGPGRVVGLARRHGAGVRPVPRGVLALLPRGLAEGAHRGSRLRSTHRDLQRARLPRGRTRRAQRVPGVGA